jgi:hypothetical protein
VPGGNVAGGGRGRGRSGRPTLNFSLPLDTGAEVLYNIGKTERQGANEMTTEQKRNMIWQIIEVLKNQSIVLNKAFDAGDTFFALVFKSDKELKKIHRLCGLK